jgi:hypothetical protein
VIATGKQTQLRLFALDRRRAGGLWRRASRPRPRDRTAGGRRRPRHLRPRRNPAVDRACRWRRTRPHPRRRQCRRGGRPSLCRRSRKRTSSRTARDRLPHRTGTADCTHLAYVPADTERSRLHASNLATSMSKSSLCPKPMQAMLVRPCACAYPPLQRLSKESSEVGVHRCVESHGISNSKRPAMIAACRVPTTANDQRRARRWDLMAHLDAI